MTQPWSPSFHNDFVGIRMSCLRDRFEVSRWGSDLPVLLRPPT